MNAISASRECGGGMEWSGMMRGGRQDVEKVGQRVAQDITFIINQTTFHKLIAEGHPRHVSRENESSAL